jgi:hypothetical protein
LAKTTVRYRHEYGQGNLDAAIAAAWHARRLSPRTQEACSGRWHVALAGRSAKAKQLMLTAEQRPRNREQRELIEELLSRSERETV